MQTLVLVFALYFAIAMVAIVMVFGIFADDLAKIIRAFKNPKGD